MSARGGGRIFQRKRFAFWWIAYYAHGKEQREVAKHVRTGKKIRVEDDPEKKEAGKFLKHRLGEIAAEQHGGAAFVGPRQQRVTVSELLDALEADYKLRGKDSPQFRSHLKHVLGRFGAQRAISVTAEQLDQFIEEMLEQDYAPASINRSTQLLGQAYTLAIERKRLASGPVIRHLSEAGNVRQGFFSEAEIRAMVEHLPEYLRDFAHFAYSTGMRKSEIASLRWEDVDGDVVRLRAENAKTGESRSVPIEGELAELMERRRAARHVKKDGRPVVLSTWIFHRDGEPVGDFRKAWATACCMASLGKLLCPTCGGAVDADYKCAACSKEWKRDELRYVGRIFHDFRRTAVRDMVRAGVAENVAMSISGHKTRSMFDRYNIHDERDQREALRVTQAYREQQAAAQREKLAAMPGQSAGVN